MNLEVLKEAEDELSEAIAYYENKESGLGLRLMQGAQSALEWIAQNPHAPRGRSKSYQRVNLKIFPYYIAYFIWADTIWILAIAHGHRRPEYWAGRKTRLG